VRTIALEEHFWTAELAAPPGTGPLAMWGPRVDDRLRDLGASRLADMDASGIDVQVISHVAPAAQGLGGAKGIARAREANDRLAGAVRAHPDRFGGFATLPTANPQAAADELERAVAELGLHVLRLIATGVFDRHPGLRLIVGHCGEMVPFMLDRIDTMLSAKTMALKPSEYFLRNIWVTTSGLFSLPPVLCTIQVLGVDRVLFSVDYPFGDNAAGRVLLDALPLAPADKARIAGGNAEQVLGLKS
jgi:predicted TIM-barrel fold metal-dependent hydrolase